MALRLSSRRGPKRLESSLSSRVSSSFIRGILSRSLSTWPPSILRLLSSSSSSSALLLLLAPMFRLLRDVVALTAEAHLSSTRRRARAREGKKLERRSAY